MSEQTFTIQGVSGASVSSIEDCDNEDFNFFRESAHGPARPARIVVDPSKLANDAIYQHAFLRFADKSLPLLSAHNIGELSQLVQRTGADVIRFEVPMSGDRFSRADIYDAKNISFLEMTDRSVVVSGKSYQVVVVMVDLGRYFAGGQYRKGFDEFRTKLEAHYVGELATKGHTVDSLPPKLRPLQNFVRFLGFPAVRQTVAVIPAYAEEVKKFGPLFTALNIPEGNRVLVSFQIDANRLGDQLYRSALFAAATHMANWTDARLRTAGKTLDDPSIPIDSRNLYQLLSALRAYGAADARGNALLAGTFGADAGQTAARLLGDSGVDTDSAFEGATNATATQGSLGPTHRGAPPPGQAATMGPLPSFRRDEPATAARPAAPTPPPERTDEQKIVDELRARYDKGKKTKGGLEITDNSSRVDGESILVEINARREDGKTVRIIPVGRLSFPEDYYEKLFKQAFRQSLGVLRALADATTKRLNDRRWQFKADAEVTAYRDGRVSVRLKNVHRDQVDNSMDAKVIRAVQSMPWPIDDRDSSITTIIPITLGLSQSDE